MRFNAILPLLLGVSSLPSSKSLAAEVVDTTNNRELNSGTKTRQHNYVSNNGNAYGISKKDISDTEKAKIKSDRLLDPKSEVEIVGIEGSCFPVGNSDNVRCIDEMTPSEIDISFSTTSGESIEAPNVYNLNTDGIDVTVVADSNGIHSVIEHDTEDGEVSITEHIHDDTFVKYKKSQTDKAAVSKFKYGEMTLAPPPVEIDGRRRLSTVVVEVADDNEQQDEKQPQVRRRRLATGKYIEAIVRVDVSYEAYVDRGSAANIATIMAEVAKDFLYTGIKIAAAVVIDTVGTSAFTSKVNANGVVCGNNADLLDDFRSLGLDGKALRHGIFQKEMSGGIIGCAWLGVLCNSGYGYGVSQLYSSNIYQNAMVISHELGHNFNAEHDSSTTNNIMYPSAGTESDIWTLARATSMHSHASSKLGCSAVSYADATCTVAADCSNNPNDSIDPACVSGGCEPSQGSGGGGGGGGTCAFCHTTTSPTQCDLACCASYGNNVYSSGQRQRRRRIQCSCSYCA